MERRRADPARGCAVERNNNGKNGGGEDKFKFNI